jgi:UDP-N-acetylmuramoyl-tripeptide--D-alanyl-D-alanine ligase
MPTFTPATLAQWTDGQWTTAPTAPLTGLAIDTRQLRRGDVFIALRTAKRDGHDFLAAAREAGAAAALVAGPVAGVDLPQLVVADPLAAFQAIARAHRRTFPGPVIGITGSAGKTSTKNLLAQLLGPEALATEANLNNHLGVPLTLTRLDPRQHLFAVVEAGISEPGEMDVLAGMIEPDLALVTLIAEAHTETLGGVAGVAREKARLPAAVRPEGLSLWPVSVEQHAPFQTWAGRKLALVRETEGGSLARGEGEIGYRITQLDHGTELELAWARAGVTRFSMCRVSDGMADNAALALTAALHLGEDPATLQTRLAQWAPAAMRGEVRREGGQLLYLDCYNANPASMIDALAAFVEISPADQPRLYVLGGMEELGAESRSLHHRVGETLRVRAEDDVWLIGSEAEAVRAGAVAAGARSEQVRVVESLESVRARLRDFRGSVFVKGSRKYRLETLFADPPSASITHGS